MTNIAILGCGSIAYSMAPYILADNPNLTARQALTMLDSDLHS